MSADARIPPQRALDLQWALTVALKALEEIAAGRHGREKTFEAFAARAREMADAAIARATEEGER